MTKTIITYTHKKPIISGLFAVLFTVVTGVTIALVMGLVTPTRAFAQFFAPAPEPAVAPVIAPAPAPIIAPVIAPAPVPAIVPVIAPAPVPAVVPVVAPAPAPVIAPVIAPAPEPVIVPIVAPAPVPAVVPVVAPAPAPAIVPVIAPAPVAAPAPVSASAPASAPAAPAPAAPAPAAPTGGGAGGTTPTTPTPTPTTPTPTPTPTGGGAGGTPTPTGGGAGSGWGGGAGGGAGGTPNVTLAVLPHIGPQPLAYLYLSQIPYTGLDLGPVGTPLYWLALIALSLGLTYFTLFALVPFVNRNAHNFGARVSALLNAPKPAPAAAVAAPAVSTPVPHIVVEAAGQDMPSAPSGYSSYDGFKSFARNGALSIDDIVKGLSQQKSATNIDEIIGEPIMPVAPIKPAYQHVEAILEEARNGEPIIPAADPANVPADVRGFTSALVEGDREAVFAGLRQYVRGGGVPAHLISSVACLLDDTYRARIDGSSCDATIARLTARFDTPKLEKLIAALTTAIDSSYTDSVTGAKLALTRALGVLGA